MNKHQLEQLHTQRDTMLQELEALDSRRQNLMNALSEVISIIIVLEMEIEKKEATK